MRPIDSATLNALAGSRSGDSLLVWVWYGGKLALPDPLAISSAKFSWDATRQIQTLNLTIPDPDGTLSPWLYSDPLGVGGSRLQVIYLVGGAGAINIEWYRIERTNPEESWVTYLITDSGVTTPDTAVPPGKRLAHVSGGSLIQLQAVSLGQVVANNRFPAPESPKGLAPTIIGEITRLVQDSVPVTTATGVVDRPVNTTLVYQGDRLNAVQDLCKRINCDYRFTGAGQLEVYPLTTQASVATLRGGPEGMLVSVDREQLMEGLYNEFYADGQVTTKAPDGTTTQVPIRGYAAITTGELRVNGPHGRMPQFYSSTMLTTQTECDAYATSMRDTQLAGLTTDLKVTCLPQPQLQLGDWVTVYNAVVDGRAIALTGRIKAMDLGFTNGTPDAMHVTVTCNYADVQNAFTSSSNLSMLGPIVRK